MADVLPRVEWGASARSLLADAAGLEPGMPAIIHIRHTERPKVTGPNSGSLLSTPAGRAAAIEFGEGLPVDRSYRLFHTVVDRSRETAESIGEGIKRRGGRAEVAGVFPFRTSFDPQAMDDYIDRVIRRCGDEDVAVAEMMNRWLAGLSPSRVFRPSGEFARMIAEYTLARLGTAAPDALDVYVTHDTWVGCTLFHWFGLPMPLDGVRFLDGFLLQPLEDEMAVWFRGKAMRVDYPHWWES
jgi:hypothetical protein